MSNRSLAWFKTGVQYDAKFTGFKINLKTGVANRCWQRITIFSYGDRQDAIEEVKKQAGYYGYQHVTIDHIVRIG